VTVVRWTNGICGALLVIAALGFLTFLPGNIADCAREPEDAWLAGFWIALLGLLAALCFTNVVRATASPRWRILANAAAVIALAALLLLGHDDPTVPPLLALCALGPLAALVGSFRPAERS
jgi:hypothetical protein